MAPEALTDLGPQPWLRDATVEEQRAFKAEHPCLNDIDGDGRHWRQRRRSHCACAGCPMAFSDTMIIIPSILHADKRAYKLQRSGTDNRGNAPLLCELTQYETYGDGTVQHSNDWCAQFSELVNAQHWQSDNLDSTALRFALSVKHKESKNGSRPTSATTEGLKRCRLASTAFAVINPGYFDWMEKVRLAMALRDEYYLLSNYYVKPADVLKCLQSAIAGVLTLIVRHNANTQSQT